MKKRLLMFLMIVLVMGLTACQAGTATQPTWTASPIATTVVAPSDTPLPTATATILPTLTATPEPQNIRIAVIGDYGSGDANEASVAKLVHSWNPDLVITVGDNNYPLGAADTIDAHIGQFYHDYIYPYSGKYGPGATVNRFFPTLGNHEWYTTGAEPYLDYFKLPGNGRYYDFTWGPVHFFALDSDENEPDGNTSDSIQAKWLQAGLAASTSPWNIVYFHYPPYSSGFHGSSTFMRWPFASWGANAVLSGHDHSYERLLVDGIPYIVNGLGGGAIYDFNELLPQSKAHYNTTYGAMLVTASLNELLFEFYNRHGALIDSYQETKP